MSETLERHDTSGELKDTRYFSVIESQRRLERKRHLPKNNYEEDEIWVS